MNTSTEYKSSTRYLPQNRPACFAENRPTDVRPNVEARNDVIDSFSSGSNLAGDSSVLAFRELAGQHRISGRVFGNAGFHKITQADGTNAYFNNRSEDANVRAKVVVKSHSKTVTQPAKLPLRQKPSHAPLVAYAPSARDVAVANYRRSTKAEQIKNNAKANKVKNPTDYTKGKPMDNAMDFIRDNFRGSGLKPEVLEKLQELQKNGKILTAHMGERGNVAEWNQRTGTITINADKIDTKNFMAEAGMQEARAMRSSNPAEAKSLLDSSKRLQRYHSEQMLELSGALIHEGTHAALGNSWSAKNDESAAYQAEAVWLGYLHQTLPGQLERAHLESMNRDLMETSKGRTSHPIGSCISL